MVEKSGAGQDQGGRVAPILASISRFQWLILENLGSGSADCRWKCRGELVLGVAEELTNVIRKIVSWSLPNNPLAAYPARLGGPILYETEKDRRWI
jgi:hypothetical protein